MDKNKKLSSHDYIVIVGLIVIAIIFVTGTISDVVTHTQSDCITTSK